MIQARNALSSSTSDGSKGSRDIYLQDIAVYNSPRAIVFEGQRWDQTSSVGSAEGRFRAFNVLGNKLAENSETGESISQIRGDIFQVVGNLNAVSLQRFTVHKSSADHSSISANRANVSRLQIQDGVLAPEPRSNGGGAFLRCESCTGMVPSINNSEEGAETFYGIAQITSATNSFFRELSLVGGRETPGTDFSVSSNAARMTDTEISDEYTSTNYTLATLTDYTSPAGTSIQDDIDDMGLDDDLEYSATPGRGIDADALRVGIGLISPYTGRTHDIEVEQAAGGWTAYFRAPTSTAVCYAKRRVFESSVEYVTDTIAAGARDRTWSVSGLSGGTRYEWLLSCGDATNGGYPDVLEGVWEAGS